MKKQITTVLVVLLLLLSGCTQTLPKQESMDVYDHVGDQQNIDAPEFLKDIGKPCANVKISCNVPVLSQRPM